MHGIIVSEGKCYEIASITNYCYAGHHNHSADQYNGYHLLDCDCMHVLLIILLDISLHEAESRMFST